MFEVRIAVLDHQAARDLTGYTSSSTEAYCETYADAHRALDALLEIHGIKEREADIDKVDPRKGPRDF